MGLFAGRTGTEPERNEIRIENSCLPDHKQLLDSRQFYFGWHVLVIESADLPLFSCISSSRVNCPLDETIRSDRPCSIHCNQRLLVTLRKDGGWSQRHMPNRSGFSERLIVNAELAKPFAVNTSISKWLVCYSRRLMISWDCQRSLVFRSNPVPRNRLCRAVMGRHLNVSYWTSNGTTNFACSPNGF